MLLKKIRNPQALIVAAMFSLVLGVLSMRVLRGAPDFFGGLAIGVFYTTAIVLLYKGFRLRRQS